MNFYRQYLLTLLFSKKLPRRESGFKGGRGGGARGQGRQDRSRPHPRAGPPPGSTRRLGPFCLLLLTLVLVILLFRSGCWMLDQAPGPGAWAGTDGKGARLQSRKHGWGPDRVTVRSSCHHLPPLLVRTLVLIFDVCAAVDRRRGHTVVAVTAGWRR